MSSYLKDKENSMIHMIRASEEKIEMALHRNHSKKIPMKSKMI